MMIVLQETRGETWTVSSYLERIGLGPVSASAPPPDARFLRQVVLAHMSVIPFENIDPFTDRPVSLEPDDLLSKLVHERRGGYCLEQNALMHDLLEAMGFAVTALRARVMWMRKGTEAPATHRLTLVEVEGEPFVVDVGFGPNSPSAPLGLNMTGEQPTPTGIYRVSALETGHRLEMLAGGRWEPLYRFDLEPTSRPDFEMANWFLSTHPKTLFKRNLVVSRVRGGEMLALVNAEMARRACAGDVERRVLSDPEDLDLVLRDDFGLELPVDAEEIWRRLPPSPVPAWP